MVTARQIFPSGKFMSATALKKTIRWIADKTRWMSPPWTHRRRADGDSDGEFGVLRGRAEFPQRRADENLKDEFLSVISHELRTPLNAILGYTDMVRDGMLGPVNLEQERCLVKVVARARELLTMINGILEVTSMGVRRKKSHIDPVNLTAFCDELRASYAFPLAKDVAIHWEYHDLPIVDTDADQLRHILENLINNAIKFTHHGHIIVAARRLDDGIAFKISDTGVGIPNDKMSIIFDKFRQIDGSDTRSYGGVGLGLYIVKQYVDGLGGTIEVDSTVGKGSCFTVALPYATPARTSAGKNAAA